jgi:hypothetical protein
MVKKNSDCSHITDLDKLYSDDGVYSVFTYGVPGINKGLITAFSLVTCPPLFFEKVDSILVVGGGNGFELVYFYKQGYNVRGAEIYIPDIPLVRNLTTYCDAADMPFDDKQFDLVFCAEVMEHVPEAKADDILKECKRVANFAVFTIATHLDPPFFTHINVKDCHYWVEKFKALGFNIWAYANNPLYCVKVGDHVKSFLFREGMNIYAGC